VRRFTSRKWHRSIRTSFFSFSFLSLSFAFSFPHKNPKRGDGVDGGGGGSVLYMAIDTPFVYQKSKKKPRKDADICEIKCKALACNIQKCIATLPTTKSKVSSASVNIELCRKVIDRYDRCCEIWREKESKGEA
jgi:hypothetical protein